MALKPGRYDPLKPDIELLDFKSKKRYGLKLQGNGLQIGTVSQDDSVLIRNVGMRVGDFDEQRSWKMGRGVENLSDNAEGFWDSMNAWTLSDTHLHQTLLWRFARGLRNCDFVMPDSTHSMFWQALLGASLYQSIPFQLTAGYDVDYARMWIRRVGTPGTLTFRLHANNSGTPGTVLQTVTKTVSDITDYVSVLQLFNWTGVQTLAASTTYHITVGGASTDTLANHWELGGFQGGSGNGRGSADGSTGWTLNFFDPYYYLADLDISRTFYPFFIDGAMYVVDNKDSGAASQVYINGDRGRASGGGATSLSDTLKSWTTNRWAGAWVRIVRGTGAGQDRQIVSNTGTQLTTAAWSVAPDTSSEYYIYATEWFSEITSSGLGQVVSTPAVVNQIVYFPQGSSVNLRRMIWNSAVFGHQFSDDSTNKCDFVSSVVSGGTTYVVKALKSASTVSFAPAQALAAPPTALSFGTERLIGSTSHLITGMMGKENYAYVFKESGVFNVDQNLNVVNLNNGIEKTPSQFNGKSSISHQQFVYYSWQHSIIRVYGQSHDDIGQNWSGKGMPNGREGYFSSMDAYTSLLMCGINAGSGTSSVLGYDGMAWHELLRAYDSNKPIRMVKVQPCEDTRNRTWVDIGGDLVYQEMPFMKGAPRLDTGVRYQHEAVLESAAIDMGTASGLPKYVKALTIFAANLKVTAGYTPGSSSGSIVNEIVVDYQTDEDVGTSNWTEATHVFESPESVAYFGLDNIRKFAYRLRIRSSDNTKPIDIRGVTPNGYARAPYKMIWTLRCKADNITSRGRLVKPPELMRWLLDTAKYPGRVMMLSQYELAHKFFVIVHPPRMFPFKPAQAGQTEEDVFTIVLEEA